MHTNLDIHVLFIHSETVICINIVFQTPLKVWTGIRDRICLHTKLSRTKVLGIYEKKVKTMMVNEFHQYQQIFMNECHSFFILSDVELYVMHIRFATTFLMDSISGEDIAHNAGAPNENHRPAASQ